jgi:ribosomal RNA-processing protein 9
MSSFFSIPGSQKKRKRDHEGPSSKRPARPPRPRRPGPTTKPQATPKKRFERDEEISGSDSELEPTEDAEVSGSEEDQDEDEDEDERDETAAQKRLRLATQYLSRVRDEVEATGWDAEQIVRARTALADFHSAVKRSF